MVSDALQLPGDLDPLEIQDQLSPWQAQETTRLGSQRACTTGPSTSHRCQLTTLCCEPSRPIKDFRASWNRTPSMALPHSRATNSPLIYMYEQITMTMAAAAQMGSTVNIMPRQTKTPKGSVPRVPHSVAFPAGRTSAPRISIAAGEQGGMWERTWLTSLFSFVSHATPLFSLSLLLVRPPPPPPPPLSSSSLPCTPCRTSRPSSPSTSSLVDHRSRSACWRTSRRKC